MIASRGSGLFAVVFAAVYSVLYVAAERWNLALVTYHPAIGELDLGRQRSRDGPAMYWYGWMLTSALGGLAAGLVAVVLPERLTRGVTPMLAWALPLAAMAACGWFMSPFFLR